MKVITEEIKTEITKMIIEEYSKTCEVDKKDICLETNIMEELGSDSLIIVSLVDRITEKYCLEVPLSVIGKYIIKTPLYTINDVFTMLCRMYQFGNDMIKL